MLLKFLVDTFKYLKLQYLINSKSYIIYELGHWNFKGIFPPTNSQKPIFPEICTRLHRFARWLQWHVPCDAEHEPLPSRSPPHIDAAISNLRRRAPSGPKSRRWLKARTRTAWCWRTDAEFETSLLLRQWHSLLVVRTGIGSPSGPQCINQYWLHFL